MEFSFTNYKLQADQQLSKYLNHLATSNQCIPSQCGGDVQIFRELNDSTIIVLVQSADGTVLDVYIIGPQIRADVGYFRKFFRKYLVDDPRQSCTFPLVLKKFGDRHPSLIPNGTHFIYLIRINPPPLLDQRLISEVARAKSVLYASPLFEWMRKLSPSSDDSLAKSTSIQLRRNETIVLDQCRKGARIHFMEVFDDEFACYLADKVIQRLCLLSSSSSAFTFENCHVDCQKRTLDIILIVSDLHQLNSKILFKVARIVAGFRMRLVHIVQTIRRRLLDEITRHGSTMIL